MANIRAGRAYLELTLRDAAFRRGLDRASAQARAWGRGILRAGAGLTAIATAGAVAFTPAIRAASDAAETLAKFNTVFGVNADSVHQFADTLAAELGRSQGQMQDFLSGAQDLFVPLGFDEGVATDMSKTLTRLAVDLGSFNNKADADVMRDLQAAMTGSSEVMKKYGVIANEAAVKQELLNSGFSDKQAKNASDQAKVMARLSIILKGTTAAQGDAVRTTNGFANQMKRLKAVTEDTLGTIGGPLTEALAPLVGGLGKAIQAIGTFVAGNTQIVGTVAKVIGVVGLLGAGLSAIGATLLAGSAILGSYGAIIGTATAALGALGAVVAAVVSPFGILIGVLAVGAAQLVDWSSVAAQAIDFVKQRLGPLAETFTATVAAIRDALAAGDIQAAATVLWAGLQLIWAEGTQNIRRQWIDATGSIQSAGINAFNQLRLAWLNLSGFLAESIALLTSAFFDLAATIKELFGGAGESLRQDADNFARASHDLRAQRDDAAAAIRADAAAQINQAFSQGNANLDKLKADLARARSDFDAAIVKSATQKDATTVAAGAPTAGPGLTTDTISDLVGKFATSAGGAVDKVLSAASTFRGDLAGRQLGGPVSVEQQQLGELKKQTRALEELADRAVDGLAFE